MRLYEVRLKMTILWLNPCSQCRMTVLIKFKSNPLLNPPIRLRVRDLGSEKVGIRCPNICSMCRPQGSINVHSKFHVKFNPFIRRCDLSLLQVQLLECQKKANLRSTDSLLTVKVRGGLNRKTGTQYIFRLWQDIKL